VNYQRETEFGNLRIGLLRSKMSHTFTLHTNYTKVK